MKQLNYTFGLPDGYWNAALPHSEELTHKLCAQLNASPQQLIDIKGVPEFILLGRRNFEEELNNPSWNRTNALRGTIAVDSEGSNDFKHLIKWLSYPNFNTPLAGVAQLSDMLVSGTIKQILDGFDLCETQCISVSVEHELTHEKRTYYYLNGIQDLQVLYRKIHWPSMAWTYIRKDTQEVIAAFEKGSMDSADMFWEELGKLRPEKISDIMKYDVVIPQYIYAQAYDMLKLSYGFVFTAEVADLIRREAGEECVVPFERDFEIFSGQV